MSIPLPPIELEGHCSTINAGTLYVLSPGGFQSLPLRKHAKWAKEASGVAVTGPACVTISPNGTDSQAQFWVIGGTTDDTSYQGLQMYSFASKSWQTIDTAVPVMQGRTNHSAAYLQDSQSIVVYAGSQQFAPSWLSSETFVVSTQSPYSIQAFTSNAPPANLPILQPWDSGSVVMVGGSVLNTQISLFSPQGGWQFLSTNLETPLNPASRGVVIDGSDGSKVLEVYDADVSPNNVAQVVLLGAGGVAAYTGETVGNGSSSARIKRALTLNNWPAYNGKNAPTAKRSDYSVATGAGGTAVLAGGNSKDPVAIFDQNENSWVDAGKFFNAQRQQPLKPTTSRHSTTTSLPTASSTPSATLASAPSSGMTSHQRTLRTLGIILGVLCGIAVLFVLVLLFLRWRKMKKRKQEGWLDEKNHGDQHMSFQDRGTSFMKETGGAAEDAQAAPPNTPWRQSKNGSSNSLGIIADKFNKRLSNKRLTGGHMQKSSFDSTSNLVKGRQAETVEMTDIEKPPLVRKMTPRTERGDRPPTVQYGPTLTAENARYIEDEGALPRANRNRSSGWSKYFATSTPQGPNGLAHIPSAYVKKHNVTSDGSTYSTDHIASQHSRIPSSTLGPALVGFSNMVDGKPVSHVATGSPSFNDSREDLAGRGSMADGQRGLIVDPGNRRESQTESVSSYNRSTMSSARTSEYYTESGATPWTPMAGNSFKEHLNSRPPSNTYDAAATTTTTTTTTEKRVPSRGKDSHFYPGAGTSYRPARSPKVKSGYLSTSSYSSTAPAPPLTRAFQQSDDRASNVTVWPKYISADYSKPAEERAAAAAAAAANATPDSHWPVPPKSTHGFGANAQADARDSNVTIFPVAGASQVQHYGNSARANQQQQQPAPGTSDLGWLKLGLNGSQNRL